MTVTRQVAMESPAVNRGQPLLLATAMGVKGEEECRNRMRIGEVTGGAAAECAAVCCCCPCAMMHLIVLAVYRVPSGLCKKAFRKSNKKRLLKRKNKYLLEENQRMTNNKKSGPLDDHDRGGGSEGEGLVGEGNDEGVGVMEAVDFDSEMWHRFYGTGFWRSSSQREEDDNQNQNLR